MNTRGPVGYSQANVADRRGRWQHSLAQLIGSIAAIPRTIPSSTEPFLLIPVGFPAPDAVVPDITRKSLDEIRIKV